MTDCSQFGHRNAGHSGGVRTHSGDRCWLGGLYVRDRTTTRRTLTRLVIFLLVSVLAGALSVVVLASPVVLGAAFVDATTGAFADLPSRLAAPTLSQTSTLVAADGTRIASFYAENRTVVPLAKMSPWARKAIVAIEDARFYDHGAVDPRGVVRAAVNDLTGGDTQGASTLTQQYVKNLLVEQAVASGDSAALQAATAPTLSRKVREVRLALGLEQQLTKDEILAGYLNVVYFGQNSYGLEAAALRYFRVHAASLTLPQAALLAGMVQEPVNDDPLKHPAAAKARRNVVLTAMLDEKMITKAQYAAAVRTPVKVTGKPLPNGCAGAGRNGFFCEAVVRSIETDPAFAALGATPAARLTAISRGGLVVRTTLDRATQTGAVDAVDAKVPVRDSSGIGAAAVTVEPGTGKVVAMAENRIYSVAAGAGRTSVNYATDAALGGASGFQTGSSFKPFTLATWLGLVAGVAALAVSTAGVAYAQNPDPSITATASVSPTKAGTKSKPKSETLKLKVVNDPASKTTAKSIEIKFPSTLKMSTKGLDQCTESDDQTLATNVNICKKEFAGPKGSAHAILNPNAPANLNFQVQPIVGKNEMLFVLSGCGPVRPARQDQAARR